MHGWISVQLYKYKYRCNLYKHECKWARKSLKQTVVIASRWLASAMAWLSTSTNGSASTSIDKSSVQVYLN